jgi:NDP-sugar pyrophosphorylase family protein
MVWHNEIINPEHTMQVILLATDEHPTLHPLSETLPGPMMPIVDRPIMARTIEQLARCGQKQILVSIYERGGPIAAYFGGGRRWGVDLKYVTQRQAWGSAGAIRWAGGLLNTTFLVLPGDALIDLDVEAALAHHRAHGGVATVIAHASRSGALASGVVLDHEGWLVGLQPSGEAELQATGALILEPGVLKYIPAQGTYETMGDLVPALLAAGERVSGYVMPGYWNPLASLGDFTEAQQVYLYSAYAERAPEQVRSGSAERVRFPSLEARQIAPGIWVGRDHSIHPTARLAAPVYIGDNCWIGREAELSGGTVIGSDVVVDDEATVSASTVLSNTYVGRLLHVERKVVTPISISDPSSGETIAVVDPFLISRVGAAAEGVSPLTRLVSALIATMLLVVLSPLWLLVGLFTLLASGGRMITRSPRVGQRVGGPEGKLRTFQIIQFGTRRPDGSLIPGGGLLERFELQRLPELVNVLRGDMLLVGVKPLSLEQAFQLTEEWHQKRHERPAGVSGLWYIQTDPESDLDTVVITDVYYAATRSWYSDLRILLGTPAVWLRRCRRRAGGLVNNGEQLAEADNISSV